MAAWAFECRLCQASQKSWLAPWELGESWWEGCLAGSRTGCLEHGSGHASTLHPANGSGVLQGKAGLGDLASITPIRHAPKWAPALQERDTECLRGLR